MIDHISCEVPFTSINHVRELLNFSSSHDVKTGELHTTSNGNIWEQANYKNLKFTIQCSMESTDVGTISFKGSLHKFECRENFSDFDKYQLSKSIFEICQLIQVKPHEIKIRSIEIGINISTTESPSVILERLVLFKNKPFEKQTKFKGNTKKGFMQRCCFCNYQIKIYDKGLQYCSPSNIMRIEIKVTKMQFFKNKISGISTLNDLLKADIQLQLMTLLIHFWDQVLLKEDISSNQPKLSNKQKEVLINSTSNDYWIGKQKSYKPYKLKRLIKIYRQVIKKSNSTKFHDEISAKINSKCTELLSDVNNLPTTSISVNNSPLSMW